MLDIKLFRQDPDRIRRSLARRGSDLDVDTVIALDTTYRETQAELDGLRAERNAASEAIARAKKAGQDASEAIASTRTLGDRIRELETRQAEVEQERDARMAQFPNLVDDSVPDGKSEDDNVEVARWGEPRSFEFSALPHWEVGEKLGILDFERAVKLAGTRFVLSKGLGASLERAIINFMLDLHTGEHGYTEIRPPYVANEETLYSNGNLPKFADQLFKLEGTRYYLIPTAEVPLTNMVRGEILDEAELPMHLTAGTPCFRSEAGAAGRDTKGLIRVHQFDKVELVHIVPPEQSFDTLEAMTGHAERILQLLELPYRKVLLCSADMGFNSSKTYDLEVWMPAQDRYREISSCSNCTDFQARRGGLRFRRGKQLLNPHTLNGSGVAVGRTLAAILENHQQADGSVRIPEALRPYLRGREVLEPVGAPVAAIR
ncbi:MAG: serine--tRNA ligase [bacterium]|nr:serine--tRNA ligase [bacterium]